MPMRKRTTSLVGRFPGQAVVASFLTGLVLLLNAMAASPALHEWFHSDRWRDRASMRRYAVRPWAGGLGVG